MALKVSTGFLKGWLGGKSVRELVNDTVLKIYSGTAPAYADDAATGVLLVSITKSGGTVAATDKGTPRVYKAVPANSTTNNTVKLTITVDGVATTYTYTILAADDTAAKVAIKVAAMLNDIPEVIAVAETDAANVWIQCAIDGLDMTVADGSGTTAITVTAKQAAVRTNALQFGAATGLGSVDATLGTLSKNTDTWSGTPVATGVAGYFRFVKPNDSGSSSAAEIRIQGEIAASGAQLDMPNPNISSGVPVTQDSYSLKLANASA